MPFGSMIMITEPSPRMVVPENTAMWRSFDDIGLMTISSVWKTPSTTMPNTWLPTWVTTTKPFVVVAVAEAQDFLQVHQRQQLVAQPQHRRVLDALDAVLAAVAGAHQFEHRKLRNGEALAAGLDDERRDDRQRQRDFDGEGRAGAGDGLQVDRAADLLDIAAHDVHADAAAGNAGDLRRRREARRENEIADFRLRLGGELGFAGEALLDGLGLDAREVEAAAVVGDLDDDVAALVTGGQPDGALRRLAGGEPLGRRFRCRDRRSCAPDG